MTASKRPARTSAAYTSASLALRSSTRATLVDRVYYSAHQWRHYYFDILPVLMKYRSRQALRDTVRRLDFLTPSERERILTWLRRHGW